MGLWGKIKKSVKHIGGEIEDIGKDVTRVAAKAVMYAAPIVGTAVLGPIGGAAGTGLSALAGQVGPNKNKAAQLKRNLLYGAAVTGTGMALGAISGAGLTATGLSSVQQLFGGGAPQPQGNPASNPTVQNVARGPFGIPLGAGVATRGDPNAQAAGLEQARAGGIASLIGNARGPSGMEQSGMATGGLGGLLNGLLNPQQQGQSPGLGGLMPLVVIVGGVYLIAKAARR